MKLLPSENIIIGKWIYANGQVSADENCKRIQWLTEKYLKKINTTVGGWTTIYQDPEDGRLWQHTYPKGELQGGGPPMLECVTPSTIVYQKIKSELHSYLKNIGYEIIEEEYYYKSFGSRHVIWSNHQKGVRLIWDSRDSWFVLEVSTQLPIKVGNSWVDIECCPFDGKVDYPEKIESISNKMLDSLSRHKWGKLN